MNLIKPFKAIRPSANLTSEVIAPPYDVISSKQAREFAKDKPHNILHVSKAEIDLDDQTDPHSPTTHQQAVNNLHKLLEQKILQQDDAPAYFLYRLENQSHSQIGIVCSVSVEAYQNNLVRKHELTQPKKEIDRSQLMIATKIQTGPVILAYQNNTTINELIDSLTKTNPDIEVVDHLNVKHQLWKISSDNIISLITQLIDDIGVLYIADGHHRSAASARACEQLNSKNSEYFLSVLFPDNQLEILGYHRLIRDDDFSIEQLSDQFTVKPVDNAFEPTNKDEFGMYWNHQWYQLTPKTKPSRNVIAADFLNSSIIKPFFNIDDIQKDPRIDFVGGYNSLEKIESIVDSGDATVGITLFPTTMQDIIQVADNNGIMPTKSTWFEPKMADGLVMMSLDELHS